MKTQLLFLYASLLFIHPIFSQGFSPNPDLHALCPGVPTEFIVNNWAGSQDVNDIDIELGNTGNNNFPTVDLAFNGQQLIVTITPASTGDIINLRLEDNSSRSNPYFVQDQFKVLITSDLAPTFDECPDDLVFGESHALVIDANLDYPSNRIGTNDPTSATEFIWFASGFTDADPRLNGQFIDLLVTDCDNPLNLQLVAVDFCGNETFASFCDIDRFVPTPCPLTGAPEFVLCGDQSLVSIFATNISDEFPSVTGYEYNWVFPENWTGLGADVALAIPSGTNGGKITLQGEVCGELSEICSVDIPLEIINPNTVLEGLNNNFTICPDSESTFILKPSVQSGVDVSWQVVPDDAVVPSSGTGQVPSFSAASGYNGPAEIIFTFESDCGSTSLTQSLVVGAPIINSGILGTGEPPSTQPLNTFNQLVICLDDISHFIELDIFGDNDGVVEWVLEPNITYTASGNKLDFILPYNNNNGTFQSTVITAILQNACETVEYSFYIIPRPCSKYGFRVSPNPAQDQISIRVFDHEINEFSEHGIHQLQLLDFTGEVVGFLDAGGSLEAVMNVSHLNPGNYVVVGKVDDEIVEAQVVITR